MPVVNAHRPLRITLLIALALIGCHDPDPPAVTTAASPAPAVDASAAEKRRLRTLESRIGRHCVEVAQSLAQPEARPTPAEEARAFKAADDLVAIVRAKPNALFGLGQDLRLYLGDVIENLEGANCDPRMVARLERGLATVRRR